MLRLFALSMLVLFSPKASANPIMIFMGGFGSCAVSGDTSEIKASSMIDEAMSEARSAFAKDLVEIRTCYALGNDPIYVSSEALGLQSSPMTRDELIELIGQAATDRQNSPIYLWGQSHGGWTAMDLVRRQPNLNFRILNTVDPISVVDCGPSVFIGGVISGSAPGCRRAPKDLEPNYPQISRSVAQWINWYQLEFSLLHSGVISAANANIQRAFNAGWWIPMGAHRLMETDETMWTRVSQQISADLRRLSSH